MRTRSFVAVLIVMSACGAAAAQDRWSLHTRAGEYAFAVGDIARAEKEFTSALEVATEGRRLEASLDNLGRLYEHQGRYAEAVEILQRLLDARSARLGSDHRGLLDVLEAAARVSAVLADHEAAERYLLHYLAVADASRGADPADEVEVLQRLVRLYLGQGRADEALPFQRRAVQRLEGDPRAEPGGVADGLESLASLELLHGAPEAAEELILRAAELRSAAGDREGLAQMLASSAQVCAGVGEIELAERLATRALVEAAQVGMADGELIAAHRALADAAWLGVGRAADSLVTLLDSSAPRPELTAIRERLQAFVELLEDVDPGDSTAAAQTVRRLAQICAMQGDVEAVLRWQLRAMELRQRSPDAAHPDLARELTDLVEVQVRSGRIADALGTNEELIRVLETRRPVQDAGLLEALERQQELLVELGQKKEAKAVTKRVRQLRRELKQAGR